MLDQYRFHAGHLVTGFHVFKLTGSDTLAFLSKQSTFDTNTIEDKQFHLASFLDPQGRIECYGWLLRDKDSFLYLVPEKLKTEADERLNRFLISEDVTIQGPFWQDWTFTLGSKAKGDFSGELFAETAYLTLGFPQDDISKLDSLEIAAWRDLTGWPSLNGEDFLKEIINNLRLFDLSVSMNKGCYPGQETVSKIATRRGAAYSPVLLELNHPVETGDLLSFDKKIGTASSCHQWKGKFYLSTSLLRDFRVEGLKVNFTQNGKQEVGIVRYYPMIHGDAKSKSEELFHEGMDFFKKDNMVSAEESLKLAVELDPKNLDALETLGVLLGRLERFPEAIEWMKRLSETDPLSVLAHTNMSLYLMRLGKIEEAEEQKSQATVKSFQKFGQEAKQKADASNLQKKQESEWGERESMFRQVLEIDAEDTLANYGLGAIAIERKNWDIAREHLEKVITQDPKYSVAYLALGKAYAGLGRKSDAKKIYIEGIKVAANKGDLMPASQMQMEVDQLQDF